MADRYLRASGNWNGSVWAATESGAAGSAATPTSSDTVYVLGGFNLSINIAAEADLLYITPSYTGTINFGTNEHTFRVFFLNGGNINLAESTINTHQIGSGGSGSVWSIDPGNSLVKFYDTPSYASAEGTSSRPLNLNTAYISGGLTGLRYVNFVSLISNSLISHPISILNGNSISLRKFVNRYNTIQSSASGGTGTINVQGTNQITAMLLPTITRTTISGAGVYYTGSGATNGGGNTGWTFADAPKIESFSDNFPGTSLNTSKWVSSTSGGASISVAGNILGIVGSSSSSYANIISKDQFLLEGSSLYFRLYKPTGGTTAGTFYLANAYRQYGVYAQRDIPDIYVNFTSTTLNFVINGHTTYINSFTFADEQFIRFRESAGRIYLDTSPNGSTWTNRFMPLLSTYGVTSTQITARPEIEYSPSGGGSFGIGELNVAQTPTAIFTGTPVSGTRPLAVNFTSSSLRADSFLWAFGDGTTSTAENPTKTYSNPGTYTVSLTVTNDLGSDTQTRANYITASVSTFTREAGGTMVFSGTTSRKLLASRTAGGTMVFGGSTRAIIIRDAETLQDKVYLYKVYDPDGNYIETWKDVASELAFTHEINSIGSTTTVELARNSDTVGTTTSPLQDHTGASILTHDNQPILASTESRNQIGSGSSVDYNNRVDIIAYYGSVEPLLTHMGEEILTHDDEPILASVGAPNGRRVFTGFISEINSRYGNSETTVVQLTSYGFDLDQFPVTTAYNNNVTTVPFNSYDPSTIVSTAIDRFAQAAALEQVSYTMRTTSSISLSGTVVSYTFRNNTYKELLDKTLELLPSNWYYRIGLGDNTVYVRERSTTPHHMFYLGKHIKALDLKGSILDVTNHTLFTGGGDPALYVEHKETPASRTRRGLQVLSDSRVILEDSADIISEGKIDEGNKLQYRTTVEILTKQYDIENVAVGQTVGFRNFGNYVDSLVLQIVGLSYTPDVLQLQLETKPLTINKRLEDVYRNLKVTENIDTPTTPV